MANPTTDYKIEATQDDITGLAAKLMKVDPGLSRHEAWIKACRLLASQ